ncbi:MAG TPA: class I SAM-dependent methyltransferase [Miltoncostaeaceae bacterium]|nr:class I SAM-dependent methyltransferase [Miltoncostaeaceae bacterium]
MDVSVDPGAPGAVADGFTSTAGDYDAALDRNAEGARRLVAAVPGGTYEVLLDVGCGTGFATFAALGRLGTRRVIGVDPAAGMLEVFRAKLDAEPGVQAELHAADVMHMPVADDAADLVLSAMAFHWFPDKPGALREIARRVRPGGLVALLGSGAGSDRELEELMRGITPPVPRPWVDVFGALGWDEGRMEDGLEEAGLVPLDVWTERRRRRADPDAYLERLRVVASHLSAGLAPEEVAAHGTRLRDALHAAAGPRGFAYTFEKLYAIARRPG